MTKPSVGLSRILSWGLCLVLMVLIAVVVVESEAYYILIEVSPTWLLPLLAGRALYLASNGLFLDAFLGKLGIRLRTIECIGLPFVTAMGNQVAPFSGGMIARATYLKRIHNVSYMVFLSLLSANYLVIFGTSGLVGVVTTLVFMRSLDRPLPLIALFSFTTLGAVILMRFPEARFPGENRWSKSINAALSSWNRVRSDRELLLRVVLYEFLGIMLNAFVFWVAYRTLGIRLLFSSALLVSLVASFSAVIGIVPGNWGVQEAVVTLSSTLVGTNAEQGLAVALLIRTAALTVAFALGPVFGYVLSRRGRSSPS